MSAIQQKESGSPGIRMGLWIQACAIMATVLAMGLSLSAAVFRLGQRVTGESHVLLLLGGMGLYILLAGAGIWAFRALYRRVTPRQFVAGVLSIYLLVQLALIFSGGSRLEWSGDSNLLQQHVRTLAEQGYTEDVLRPMSDSYDFQVWARRSVPFYLLLYRISGPLFPVALQCFNALLMVLAAFLTWRLASLLLGERAAAIALILQVLMPWRLFTHLDLAHHILGGLYYTLAVWILVEWHQPSRTRLQQAGLAALMTGLLPLMHLEGGIDFVLIGAIACTLFLTWLTGKVSARNSMVSVAALLLLPIVAMTVLTGPLDTLLDKADEHHYDSGILAWSTRGWSVETGGQYCGTYEQLDVLTPQPKKKSFLFQLLASQAYYNPAAVAVRQIPIKAAKYFMVGYASSFEEVLKYNQLPKLRMLYTGARTLYLIGLLPLAIGGGLLFLVRFRRRDALSFVIPFAFIVTAYVVFGESDPRYSAYIHTYVCLAAAASLTWLRTDSRQREIPLRQALTASILPTLSLLLLFALWVAVLFAARPLLQPRAMWDWRQAAVEQNQPLPISPALAPFEIHLPPREDRPGWGQILLPPQSGSASTFSFYLLPVAGLSASRGTPITLRLQTSQGSEDLPLTLPARVQLSLPPDSPASLELLSDTTPAPFPLLIGYANRQPAE